MDTDLVVLSEQVGAALRERSLTLATAESCTGGWVAQVVTHTAGSSAWFDRGFVTYANDAKVDMLGVAAEDPGHPRCGEPANSRGNGGRRPRKLQGT